MKRFKGTQGRWAVEHLSGCVIGVGVSKDTDSGIYTEMVANSILPDTDAEYEKVKDQIEADFTLISAAPDLLDAIQYYFAVLDEARPGWRNSPDHVLQKMIHAVNKAVPR